MAGQPGLVFASVPTIDYGVSWCREMTARHLSLIPAPMGVTQQWRPSRPTTDVGGRQLQLQLLGCHALCARRAGRPETRRMSRRAGQSGTVTPGVDPRVRWRGARIRNPSMRPFRRSGDESACTTCRWRSECAHCGSLDAESGGRQRNEQGESGGRGRRAPHTAQRGPKRHRAHHIRQRVWRLAGSAI